MKYVKFDDDSFLVFPDVIGHNEVASKGRRISSAGFCGMTCDEYGKYTVTAWGESLSLNIKSKAGDGVAMGEALSRKS